MNHLPWLLAGAVFVSLPSPAAQSVQSDICVYGGTSGGVAAAVAAARLGKSVVLVSLNNHVGGMSASGLGVTDIGPGGASAAGYIGGISKEFYRRLGQAYGSAGPVYYFEPHVAENVFWQMLAEAGVTVYSNQLLSSVTMTNNRIRQLATQDGSTFSAREFIDTTYEGDLMAAAGVTFTFGREGTNTYNETQAGTRSLGGSFNYDPYVAPGNPGSGLLPLVNAGNGGTVGDGDKRLQAYNFRLCLTQNSTNKIALAAPAGYTESRYELVKRYIAARVAAGASVALNQLIDVQTIIPNGKTDINANGELSTDYIGYNYTWATNTYALRAAMRQEHEDYIRGLLYFYATSTGVPASLNIEMQSWGLAKDEFQDTGGWPWQIYVREARRMVSDYVMIQNNAMGKRFAPDPIALGYYPLDSHGVQRVASGNYCRSEGGVGGQPPFPYGISYHSIVARTGECANVFATFALSASHVAFASCRMEPVFMMTSQSAGTAAAFAIDDNVDAQAVNCARLSTQLKADGQVLEWPAAWATTNGIIVDNGDPSVVITGTWQAGANEGYWNTNYIHDQNSLKGSKSVKFTPNLPTNGTYEVYGWWVADSKFRSWGVPIDIVHSAGTTRVLADQRSNGSQWVLLLTTNFNTGTGSSATIGTSGTTNYVVADAIRWLPVGGAVLPPPIPTIQIVASDPVADETGGNPARFTIVRTAGDTNAVVTVAYLLSGSATNGVDYANLPGTITLVAGAVATNLYILPVNDGLPEPEETVTVTLQTSATYTVGPLNSATAIILASPDLLSPVVLFCTNSVSISTDANCQATLPNLTVSPYFVASDNSGFLTITQAPAASVALAAGSTNFVQITAFDAAGNATNRTVPVIVSGMPKFTAQPTRVVAAPSAGASFSAMACGPGPLSYQWQHDGTNLAGATDSALVLSGITVSDGGAYAAAATNSFGYALSEAADLVVADPPLLLPSVAGGGLITLGFQTVTGATYVIEYKADLRDPVWHLFSTQPGTGGTLSIPDGLTNAIRFYRARIQ